MGVSGLRWCHAVFIEPVMTTHDGQAVDMSSEGLQRVQVQPLALKQDLQASHQPALAHRRHTLGELVYFVRAGKQAQPRFDSGLPLHKKPMESGKTATRSRWPFVCLGSMLPFCFP